MVQRVWATTINIWRKLSYGGRLKLAVRKSGGMVGCLMAILWRPPVALGSP